MQIPARWTQVAKNLYNSRSTGVPALKSSQPAQHCVSPLRRMSTQTPPASHAPKDKVYFSTFDVTDQVFLRNEHAIGIVNLKPIVPCHVLLIPPSPSIQRLSSLPPESLPTFFSTVQKVVSVLEKVTGSTSTTVSIQDGPDAGQSVNHLHVHILPRKKGDFTVNDEIYDKLEHFGFQLPKLLAQRQGASTLAPDADELRQPRSRDEMKREAQWLTDVFAREGSA